MTLYTGPSFWPSEFCQGEKQSPINIEVDATVYDEYLTDVDPITLTSGDTMKMGNNGHSGIISNTQETTYIL